MNSGMRAAAAVLCLVGTLGCSGPPRSSFGGVGGASPAENGWLRLADVPLSAREDPVVATVGRKVVVMGGHVARWCRGGGSCPRPPGVGGGAVLDLDSGSWKRMAPVPRGFTSGPWAVSGTKLVVLGWTRQPTIGTYDVKRNSWDVSYPAPPRPLHGNDFLAVVGDDVYANPEDDGRGRPGLQRLDLSTREWSRLPASTNSPWLGLRMLFMTPAGLMVLGAAAVDPTGSHERALGEVFTSGAWMRLSDTHGSVSGRDWSWTGNRLVAPTFADPDSSGLALDPTTGAWTRLPPQPKSSSPGWYVGPTARGPLVADEGAVYDDKTRTFERLVPPTPRVGRRAAAGTWVGGRLLVVDNRRHAWLSPEMG
jgi:hypothetical protein